jgi:hypothetical protein
MMRIRILQRPPIPSVDGIRVDCFVVGAEYEVGNSIGALFLAEGWAEPLPLDSPAPYRPFSSDDLFTVRHIDQPRPRKLIRWTYPPSLDSDKAADASRRRRSRPRRSRR